MQNKQTAWSVEKETGFMNFTEGGKWKPKRKKGWGGPKKNGLLLGSVRRGVKKILGFGGETRNALGEGGKRDDKTPPRLIQTEKEAVIGDFR